MKRWMTKLTAILVLCVPALSYSATWQLDPEHSSFQFKIRHLTVSNVKGEFGKSKGTFVIDDQDITSLKVDITIDAASVDTNNAMRDGHLRGADFFDVAKYPVIMFVSKKVVNAGTGRLKVIGDLTIRGVTREITVDVEGPTEEVKDPWGNFRRGATGTTRINRRDFGITWSKVLDSGGLIVADEVDIYVDVELVKK